MGNLSEHVSRHEVACSCGCGMAGADIELVGVIEDCAAHFEAREARRLAVHFNSWNRCPIYNISEAVGGAANSTHPDSIATDFWISGVSDDEVADYLEKKYPNKYGIGRYLGRTHIDMRAIKARWDAR